MNFFTLHCKLGRVINATNWGKCLGATSIKYQKMSLTWHRSMRHPVCAENIGFWAHHAAKLKAEPSNEHRYRNMYLLRYGFGKTNQIQFIYKKIEQKKMI